MIASQRCIVTGAGGFIGSRLCQALLHVGGCHIYAFVQAHASLERLEPLRNHIDICYVDYLHAEALSTLFQKIQPQMVFHLHGSLNHSESAESILQNISANIVSTCHIMKACAEVSPIQVVMTGSCEEYGQNEIPVDEKTVCQPQSSYAMSKYAGFVLGTRLLASRKIPWVLFRLSTVYGPGQNAHMFIPQLITHLLNNQPFEMTGGKQERNFIYIDDVIQAYMAVMGKMPWSGGIINLASDHSVPIRDVAGQVANLMGRENLLRLGGIPYRPLEVGYCLLDNSKAKVSLSWNIQAPLMQRLQQTIQWYQDKTKQQSHS